MSFKTTGHSTSCKSAKMHKNSDLKIVEKIEAEKSNKNTVKKILKLAKIIK